MAAEAETSAITLTTEMITSYLDGISDNGGVTAAINKIPFRSLHSLLGNVIYLFAASNLIPSSLPVDHEFILGKITALDQKYQEDVLDNIHFGGMNEERAEELDKMAVDTFFELFPALQKRPVKVIYCPPKHDRLARILSLFCSLVEQSIYE